MELAIRVLVVVMRFGGFRIFSVRTVEPKVEKPARFSFSQIFHSDFEPIVDKAFPMMDKRVTTT